MQQGTAEERGAVRTRGPGASGAAAEAERSRRAGRVAEAERVARQALSEEPGSPEAILALALALLDQGRVGEARAALEGAVADLLGLDGEGPEIPLSDDELDLAVEGAATELDSVIDADRIAQDALREVETTGPELAGPSPGPLGGPDSPFATRTVADLLERQGRRQEAERIRASLVPPARSSAPEGRGRVLSTLERWLDNLRGGRE